MLPRLFSLVLTVGIFLFAQPVFADNYVRCLQNQLAQLGYDPGPVDGIWGNKTKAAALGLREAEPRLQEVPALGDPRRMSAVSWCREVGIHFALARQFRPVDDLPPDLLFDADVNLVQKGRVRASARRAQNYLRAKYGIDPAGLTTIVFGRDRQQISKNLKQAARKRGWPTIGLTPIVNRRCKDADPIAAFAIYEIIVFCADASLPVEEVWPLINERLMVALIHEFVHIFQFEYSLASTHPNRFQKEVSLIGPAWLVEGAAMMVEIEHHGYDLGKPGLRSVSVFQLEVQNPCTRLMRFSA